MSVAEISVSSRSPRNVPGILLAAILRPGDVGGIRQLLPRLRLLVTQLRRRWPKRPIVLRADGEFAKPKLLDYAEYAGCLYAIGLPLNPKLSTFCTCGAQAGDKKQAKPCGGRPCCYKL